MNYTETEQQLIAYTAALYSARVRDNDNFIDGFKSAFESSAMQQIIESRVKAAKIELLKEVIEDKYFTYYNATKKLTELTK